jgi:hypothetical protein
MFPEYFVGIKNRLKLKNSAGNTSVTGILNTGTHVSDAIPQGAVE